jgi:hypothetical protein
MATAAQVEAMPSMKRRDLWKIGDASVLLAYACVVLWTLQYHEKWADEAQAWLIARDLDLRTIWFHELRYEGSPGLWHTTLWIAQHVFHARYGALGYIGAAFAIAGAAVLLFLAPFPRYIRWPLAFTYFIVYQYAVIARPYTLLPLLALTAATLFRDKEHPGRITIVLALLALLTLHGTILAACLGFAYLLDAWKVWLSPDKRLQREYVFCIGALAGVFLFTVITLKPTPDVEEFATKQQVADLARSMHVQLPSPGVKLVSVVSGAFLGYAIPSFAFLLLAAAWCAWRKQWVAYVLPVAALIAFYIVVHGYSHHHGTVTIAALTGIWIAWPGKQERATFSERDALMLKAMEGVLLVFCASQIWDAGVVIKNEYRYPYSGAGDAASYLIAQGAERAPILGFLYGISGVQPYFDHNIFANLTTSYYHHGVPLEGSHLDLGEVASMRPGFIVIFTEQPQLMLDSRALDGLGPLGYRLDHFSDGYMLYRRGVYVRQTYLIFKSADWDSRFDSQPLNGEHPAERPATSQR